MTGRGVSTFDDLRDRCEVDPATHCWIWQGACSGNGDPRIHSLDYALVEKRLQTGARAAWQIAHGTAIPAWAKFVYRACCQVKCVNPAHMRLAADRAELGRHQSRSGTRKGTSLDARRRNLDKAFAARGILPTPADTVRAIRAEPDGTTVEVMAAKYGVSIQVASRIRRRASHKGVPE